MTSQNEATKFETEKVLEGLTKSELEVAVRVLTALACAARVDSENDSLAHETAKNLDRISVAAELCFANLTNEQKRREDLRKTFNDRIRATNDRDEIARLELCREYFTNPEFARALANETFRLTNEPTTRKRIIVR